MGPSPLILGITGTSSLGRCCAADLCQQFSHCMTKVQILSPWGRTSFHVIRHLDLRTSLTQNWVRGAIGMTAPLLGEFENVEILTKAQSGGNKDRRSRRHIPPVSSCVRQGHSPKLQVHSALNYFLQIFQKFQESKVMP